MKDLTFDSRALKPMPVEEPRSFVMFPKKLLYVFLVAGAYSLKDDILSYVDPLIGSGNQGNVFAGATLPYGMAKAVADSSSGFNQGGFTIDSKNISGFSSMHDTGTGGSASLGNFALFAHKECFGDDVNGCIYPKHFRQTPYVPSSLRSSPGYFSLELETGVKVDMTVTQHTSLFRFKFPSNSTRSPLILMDLTDLQNSRQDNATIMVDPVSGRMTGSAKFIPSFGIGDYTAYFCADFTGSDLRDNGVFVNSRASVEFKDLNLPKTIFGNPLPAGAFNRFAAGSETVLARVGVSLISSNQACSSAEQEIPKFDFERTLGMAQEIWRKKLSPIDLDSTGVEESFIKNFYSGIYRSMVNPQDYTGENPLWDSDEPYFDSFYCLWDTFRSQIPFLMILDPEVVALQVRSLIDTYKHEGWLPECRMSLCKGFTQGGSSADIVLADAYLKGITDGIDWDLGYEAVVNDAEKEPHNWCCEGRGGLDSWKTLGYIPVQDFDHRGFGLMISSISRTLEYSYNDFAIAQLGNALGGKETDVEKYIDQSGNWKNLFKADQTSFIASQDRSTNKTSLKDTGFVGFFQPRNLNQTFSFQDPLTCSNLDHNPDRVCNLNSDAVETYESSIWEYSFFVPHDQATLITKFGGPKSFIDRLEYLHNNKINYIGDEPSYLTVFQYHFAGRPALSAIRSHFYIPSFFQPLPGGLPGNDDSGAMGSFVAFAMIGLFPNPGQNVYFITPPYFQAVSITSPATGKTAKIRNINFDPTYKNIFIQSATLNGEPYTKNWITHSFFTEGKELILVLGSQESSWGTRVEDLPPSLGSYDGFADKAINRNATSHVSRVFSAMELDNVPSAMPSEIY